MKAFPSRFKGRQPDPVSILDHGQAQSSRDVSREKDREDLGPPASGTPISVFPIEGVEPENFPASECSKCPHHESFTQNLRPSEDNRQHTEKEDSIEFPLGGRC